MRNHLLKKTLFEFNGQPNVIRWAEMHFAYTPKTGWKQYLQMVKTKGLNTVCTYLFWNILEKLPDQFSGANPFKNL